MRLRRTLSQPVTGGLYRIPARVHRNISDLRLLAIPPSGFQVAENHLNQEKSFYVKPLF
jgi:hypothetical protein